MAVYWMGGHDCIMTWLPNGKQRPCGSDMATGGGRGVAGHTPGKVSEAVCVGAKENKDPGRHGPEGTGTCEPQMFRNRRVGP